LILYPFLTTAGEPMDGTVPSVVLHGIIAKRYHR
jgi:hypothetical protein